MILSFRSNYNFEILSFLNILTSDEFYVQYNRASYDKFFPLLNEKSKENITSLAGKLQRTNIAFPFNLILAQISGYENNSIMDSFAKKDEIGSITSYLKQLPYVPSEYLEDIDTLFNMCIEIISDLENLGFNEYWQAQIKPSVESKCKEYQEFMDTHDFISLFTQYKPSLPDEIHVNICAFHRPHGTKLTLAGDAMILSDNFSKESALMIVAHEMFHPTYDINKVSESLKILSEKPWVIKAFDNQNENCRYSQMSYFIEENIVEALGILVAYKLGVEKNPYEYFEQHDYGSHVVAPKFFKYMLDNPKNREQEFEQYLYEFSCTI